MSRAWAPIATLDRVPSSDERRHPSSKAFKDVEITEIMEPGRGRGDEYRRTVFESSA